jgi:hypothetical protein
MGKGRCRNQEESARIRFPRDALKDPVGEVLKSEESPCSIGQEYIYAKRLVLSQNLAHHTENLSHVVRFADKPL